jgi:hypothetical protein
MPNLSAASASEQVPSGSEQQARPADLRNGSFPRPWPLGTAHAE